MTEEEKELLEELSEDARDVFVGFQGAVIPASDFKTYSPFKKYYGVMEKRESTFVLKEEAEVMGKDGKLHRALIDPEGIFSPIKLSFGWENCFKTSRKRVVEVRLENWLGENIIPTIEWRDFIDIFDVLFRLEKALEKELKVLKESKKITGKDYLISEITPRIRSIQSSKPKMIEMIKDKHKEVSETLSLLSSQLQEAELDKNEKKKTLEEVGSRASGKKGFYNLEEAKKLYKSASSSYLRVNGRIKFYANLSATLERYFPEKK